MSFCYKKILGVFTHLRVTTPNIIEPLSVLGVEAAAKNIQSGKYGKQRLFLLY